MAGQIGEYISTTPLKEWTPLVDVAGCTLTNGKKYSIYNNGATSIRFIASKETNPEFFGTVLSQGSIIYYKPIDGEKLLIKGVSFNLVISEV